MEYMKITSTQNDRIKFVRSLKNKRERDAFGVFAVEGVNILRDVPADTHVRELFIKESEYEKLSFIKRSVGIEATIVADKIFDAMCDTVTPSGALAVVDKKPSLPVGRTALLLCGVSDSGNVGTIIRTCVARGIDTVLLYGDCADPYSPKSVRATMGGIFHINIITILPGDLLALKDEYEVVSLDMNGEDIFSYKRKGKLIIAVGGEAHGIPQEIRELSDKILSIPMSGKIESLNAAVSAAVAMYQIEL